MQKVAMKIRKQAQRNCHQIGNHQISSLNGGGILIEPKNGRTQADSEVLERPERRRFSAEYKLRILKEVESSTKPGEQGAILRREGLYASNIATWRKQRDSEKLSELKEKKRGRKKQPPERLTQEVSRLKRENESLRRKLKKSEAIIEVQKKISEIMGISLKTDEDNESN